MRQRVANSIVLGTAVLILAGAPSTQSAPSAGIRGRVVDEAGKPLADVKIDFEFKGESRIPVKKTQQSDKKGGFVRVGLPDGKWQITFSKEGYKTYAMEIQLSLGGFSEAGDVVMKVSETTTAAAPGEPAAAVLPATPEASKAGEDYTKALEAARAGRFEEAEPVLKDVISRFPDLANAHYNLAYVYQMKKDWKAAEAEYLRVTELEPMKSDAYLALAAVRELDGRGPEAAAGLQAAATGFEQDAKFQYALGIISTNAGKTPEAEAAFKKAAALDPSNPEPLFQLGTIAVGQNKVAEAVGLLEKYVGMSGQVPANVETAKALLTALKKK